ncbi:MAG: YXWGXW repeat-containing protein [Herminiimonas sp.]|nr:YXWGXW repeat-containing protein [Herminiimonas sp.]
MLKKTLLASLMVAALGGISQSAVAERYVRVAPPPPRAEMVPQARRGYVWTPGHWEWRRQQHVWIGGSWLRDRPGYSYRSPTWIERDGRWAMQSGRWARGGRDRDGDGVPNRVDARPNDPNRR